MMGIVVPVVKLPPLLKKIYLHDHDRRYLKQT